MYYLHCILHDWTDVKAIEILKQIKPAMRRGYSKILLNKLVIQETDTNSSSTALDLIVMASLSGRERSQADWERLVTAAGLRVNRIYSDPNTADESIVEVELE